MATCSSCPAEIIWARTGKGKAMPLDALPEKRVVIENEVARVVNAYVPHFATCPAGKQWSGKPRHG